MEALTAGAAADEISGGKKSPKRPSIKEICIAVLVLA
jgi:hypothetical protein